MTGRALFSIVLLGAACTCSGVSLKSSQPLVVRKARGHLTNPEVLPRAEEDNASRRSLRRTVLVSGLSLYLGGLLGQLNDDDLSYDPSTDLVAQAFSNPSEPVVGLPSASTALPSTAQASARTKPPASRSSSKAAPTPPPEAPSGKLFVSKATLAVNVLLVYGFGLVSSKTVLPLLERASENIAEANRLLEPTPEELAARARREAERAEEVQRATAAAAERKAKAKAKAAAAAAAAAGESVPVSATEDAPEAVEPEQGSGAQPVAGLTSLEAPPPPSAPAALPLPAPEQSMAAPAVMSNVGAGASPAATWAPSSASSAAAVVDDVPALRLVRRMTATEVMPPRVIDVIAFVGSTLILSLGALMFSYTVPGQYVTTLGAHIVQEVWADYVRTWAVVSAAGTEVGNGIVSAVVSSALSVYTAVYQAASSGFARGAVVTTSAGGAAKAGLVAAAQVSCDYVSSLPVRAVRAGVDVVRALGAVLASTCSISFAFIASIPTSAATLVQALTSSLRSVAFTFVDNMVSLSKLSQCRPGVILPGAQLGLMSMKPLVAKITASLVAMQELLGKVLASVVWLLR